MSNAAEVLAYFHRLGLSETDAVALSGGHTLGRCHRHISGFEGRWDTTESTFDNAYFAFLVNGTGYTQDVLGVRSDSGLLWYSPITETVQLHPCVGELGHNRCPHFMIPGRAMEPYLCPAEVVQQNVENVRFGHGRRWCFRLLLQQ